MTSENERGHLNIPMYSPASYILRALTLLIYLKSILVISSWGCGLNSFLNGILWNAHNWCLNVMALWYMIKNSQTGIRVAKCKIASLWFYWRKSSKALSSFSKCFRMIKVFEWPLHSQTHTAGLTMWSQKLELWNYFWSTISFKMTELKQSGNNECKKSQTVI